MGASSVEFGIQYVQILQVYMAENACCKSSSAIQLSNVVWIDHIIFIQKLLYKVPVVPSLIQ